MGNHLDDKSTRSYLVVIHENSVCSGVHSPSSRAPGVVQDRHRRLVMVERRDGLGDQEDPAPGGENLHRLAHVPVARGSAQADDERVAVDGERAAETGDEPGRDGSAEVAEIVSEHDRS